MLPEGRYVDESELLQDRLYAPERVDLSVMGRNISVLPIPARQVCTGCFTKYVMILISRGGTI